MRVLILMKSRQFTRGQKFFLIMAIFVCGLLLYSNGVAFNLISAPTYIVDVIAFSALAVAVGLTVVMLTIVIRDNRRILSARKQKSNVDILVKLDQQSDTVSSPAVAQEVNEKVDYNDQDVQTIQTPEEVEVAVVPSANISKRRSLFAAIIAVVVGLLIYVNIVAFGLFALPEFTMYAAAVGAAVLIGVVFVLALREKRRGVSAKIQKESLISSVQESNETLDLAPSSVDFQESTKVVETKKADIQPSVIAEEVKVSVLPKVKSSKKKYAIIFTIALAVCLLSFADIVAFGLISLPGYFAYVLVACASALGIIAVTLALVDKRKKALPKAPIVEDVGVVQESNILPETPDTVSSPTIAQTIEDKVETEVAAIETAKVPDEMQVPIIPPAPKASGKRTLFIITIAFTAALLFFANAVAFGLISLPQYVIYAAVAGAVALASISVALILGGKLKVLGNKIKRFIAEPLIEEIPDEVKEPEQTPDITSPPVIAQTSPKKISTYDELFRQFGIQNDTNKLGTGTIEKQIQQPKKPTFPPTKVICPACRKEFNLPNYERNYIVDFGRPKKSNLIKQCPHCQTLISLKLRNNFDEEDIWKD